MQSRKYLWNVKRVTSLFLIPVFFLQTVQLGYADDKKQDASELLRSIYQAYNKVLQKQDSKSVLSNKQIENWIQIFQSRPGNFGYKYEFLSHLNEALSKKHKPYLEEVVTR